MNTQSHQQSSFVSVVAWLFIIMQRLCDIYYAAAEHHAAFPVSDGEMRKIMLQQQETGQLPPMAQFMAGHFEVFFGLMFLLAVLTLVASIGLLLRKNWARLTFIILMIAGIIWNLGSLAVQQVFFRTMPVPEDAPADFVQHSQGMMNIMNIFSIALAVIVCALFGWIAWRLASPAIRQEFQQAT
ncbi:MAG: hypothetical protein U5P41_03235 [Gammaproteobacteria bacterium]|nr:hypothetical protein [Gammaproteobacteria bacterium]